MESEDDEIFTDSTDFEYEEEEEEEEDYGSVNGDFDLGSVETKDALEVGGLHLSNEKNGALGVSYTFPVSRTKMNTKTHRMIYKPVSIEDMESSLDKKVTELNSVLQLGKDVCLTLMVKYKWNQDKLLEDYTNGNMDDLQSFTDIPIGQQTTNDTPLIEDISDPEFTCNICFNSPTAGHPLKVFRLSCCNHPYCVDCYTTYLKDANQDKNLMLKCPEPGCKKFITLSDLEKISNFEWKRVSKGKRREEQKRQLEAQRPITEDEIRKRFQSDKLSSKLYDMSIDDASDIEDEDLIYPSDSGEETDKIKCDTTEKSDTELEAKLVNFQQQIMEKERLERERERNKTILSKYRLNLAENYCSTHYKNFRNCPIPNCDSMVMQLGFDSSVVSTLAEFVEKNLIPTVVCSHKHRFCFNCLQEDHSPCPCNIAKKWEKKCKDDTETCHWLAANTKDCPHCSTPIEKNGGCNQMICSKCGFAFCWICLKDWSLHNSHYSCSVYVDNSKEKKEVQDKNRGLLQKYMFYFKLYDNQKESLEADKRLLKNFEGNIRKLQKRCRISWIETLFYRECMDILLEARRELMWTYAAMYYVDTKSHSELVKAAQQVFSQKIERLSRLFLDTKIEMVIKQKETFLNYGNLVEKSHGLLQETFLDCIANNIVKLN